MQRALLIVNRKARRARLDLTSGIKFLEERGMSVMTHQIANPAEIPTVIRRFGPSAES